MRKVGELFGFDVVINEEMRTDEIKIGDWRLVGVGCVAGCLLDRPTGVMWHSPGCPHLEHLGDK